MIKFNIIEKRKTFFIISALIIITGIIFMAVNSSSGSGIFNYDTDFTGGTAMVIDIGREFDNDEISNIILEITQAETTPQIQKVVDSFEVSIKMQSVDGDMRTAIVDKIKETYEITDNNVLSVSDVSATVSSEMQSKAVLSIVIACIAMLIYISFRFRDFRAGASAILALLHDVLIVLAAYAIFRIPVNNAFIAAILTVLGYSINATIVIFDRIRENKNKFVKADMAELYDNSIKQTLARSLNTSLTTLFAIGSIYVFGVDSIKQFSLPIVIGVLSGTFSSIFEAGSFWYMMLEETKKAEPEKAA